MTNRVVIPRTVDAAGARLDQRYRLIQASGWERAAIVFAFTRRGGQNSPTQNPKTGVLTSGEFAALGYQGLRSPESVRRYRNAWATTGRPAVPGGTVDLDGLGVFPPDDEITNLDRRDDLNDSAETEGAGHRSTQQIATHLPAMKAAIKGDVKVAAAAAAALDELTASRPAARTQSKQDTPRDEYQDALALMVKIRAAHRNLAEAVTYAQNVRGAGADEIRAAGLAEIDWIEGACSVIRTGLNGGPLDDQIAEFMDAEAGR